MGNTQHIYVQDRACIGARILLVLAVMMLALPISSAPQAAAVGEASTRFGVFVPATDYTGRNAALVVTAITDNTLATITDTAEDGDQDDSAKVTLNTGQSHIIYIRDGAIDDDLGGKKDGDFFTVESDQPVLVANLTVNTDWQHAFVPADNKRMVGTSFYLYRPPGLDIASHTDETLNVFAYSDHTEVRVIDITNGPGLTTSGTTSVLPDEKGAIVLSGVLMAGQDLLEVNQWHAKLAAGHTYHIVSSQDVSVQFGSLGKYSVGSRDGGAYVPGQSGYSADTLFYFTLPFFVPEERELRIVAYDQAANVTVYGWNTSTSAWDTVASRALSQYGHLELVGAALKTYETHHNTLGYYFFKVVSNSTVSVFEASWLETGSYGTSDIATFISSQDGTGAGTFFQAYMGPPAIHPYTKTQLSHLIVSAYQTATVEVFDSDSYGEYIELYNNTGASVDLGGWRLTNADGQMIEIPAGSKVNQGGVYLLHYHARATSAPPDWVYGGLNPNFRLANGGETLQLRRPDNTVVDTLEYTSTGWLSHGIYYALERIDPGQPFTAGNARDAVDYQKALPNNLGDYYGSPGKHTGQKGSGNGSVVINEVMSGRIYRQFDVPANGYANFAIGTQEWEGLHNGNQPQTTANPPNTPENPYLVVRSLNAVPISVMNANWNDNWMTYATGVLRPDPSVGVTLNRTAYQPNETLVATLVAANRFGALYNPVTSIRIPNGIEYKPGSYSTSAQLAGVTPKEVQLPDGAWLLTWELNGVMPPGSAGRQSIVVTGTISAWATDGTLLPVIGTLRGADAGGQLYASQDTAVANVTKNQPPVVRSDILVNEVMHNPVCAGDQWIEIVNNSDNDVSIAGYELAGAGSLIYRFPDNLPDLLRRSYLVVRLSAGQDVTTTLPMWLYASAATSDMLDLHEDQVALFDSRLRTPTSIVDYMRWNDTGGVARPGDLKLAISTGHWVDGKDIAPSPGQASLNRKVNGGVIVNTHSADDWTSGTPSPGQLNDPAAPMPLPDSIQNLTAVPLLGQNGAVKLTWTNPSNPDKFDRVALVRSLYGYPSRISDGTVVYDGAGTSFIDTGSTRSEARAPAQAAMLMAPAVPIQYYSAFSFKSGVIACATTAAQAQAVPSQQVHLAYEDQKNIGWSDWDTNDLVVAQDTGIYASLQGIERIEARFTAEARGAAFDHVFHWSVPVNGAALFVIERYSASGALIGVETSKAQDLIDAVIFTSTHYAMPANAPNSTSNTMSGTHKIDGLSARVIITPLDPGLNPVEWSSPLPYDPWIFVMNTKEEIHLNTQGGVGNTQLVIETGSPLYGRDLPLALSFNQAWKWPLEEHRIWTAYPGYSSFVESGGIRDFDWYLHPDPVHIWETYSTTAQLADYPQQSLALRAPAQPELAAGWPQTISSAVFASPVIADIDADGSNELVVAGQGRYGEYGSGVVSVWQGDGTLKWSAPKSIAPLARSSPSVGDVDGDGLPEVVIGSGDGTLHVWRGDGTPMPGFAVNVGAPIKSSVALANVDADAALEMVFKAGNGRVYIYNGDGSPVAPWPRATGDVTDTLGNTIMASTPAVGDVDGDGEADVVVGSTDGNVYAWHADGTPLTRLWPRPTGDWVYGSPVIVDLDRDGYRDVVAASGDGFVYAWRGDGGMLPGFPVWLGSGVVSSPAVVDVEGDHDLEVIIGTLAGRVYVVHHTGAIASGWPKSIGSEIDASPVAADVNNDGNPEIFIGGKDGALYAWSYDGQVVTGWPRQTGDWVVASPAVGDLNGDSKAEVATGAFNGQVHVWSQPGIAYSTARAWPTFRRDPSRAGLVPTDVPIQPLPALRVWYLPSVGR